ncbi:hypothetical protein [Candidatus Uabimicrobium sp. HlEnr_7]|uniref:hypothetical protein n=1 Tax=Candidatus Uabimicrobium helgolandensis TaxID=3095367 RepID=UPI003556BCF4
MTKKVVKRQSLQKIEDNMSYNGCTFYIDRKIDKIFHCDFENCSFRNENLYIVCSQDCTFVSCNFVKLKIDALHNTTFKNGYINHLSLKGCSSFCFLQNVNVHNIHLRNIHKLPQDIVKFSQLKTLDIAENLRISKLPKSIYRLPLLFLDVSQTRVNIQSTENFLPKCRIRKYMVYSAYVQKRTKYKNPSWSIIDSIVEDTEKKMWAINKNKILRTTQLAYWQDKNWCAYPNIKKLSHLKTLQDGTLCAIGEKCWRWKDSHWEIFSIPFIVEDLWGPSYDEIYAYNKDGFYYFDGQNWREVASLQEHCYVEWICGGLLENNIMFGGRKVVKDAVFRELEKQRVMLNDVYNGLQSGELNAIEFTIIGRKDKWSLREHNYRQSKVKKIHYIEPNMSIVEMDNKNLIEKGSVLFSNFTYSELYLNALSRITKKDKSCTLCCASLWKELPLIIIKSSTKAVFWVVWGKDIYQLQVPSKITSVYFLKSHIIVATKNDHYRYDLYDVLVQDTLFRKLDK